MRIRILLLEDSADDALLLHRELHGSLDLEMERVETAAAFAAALDAGGWDLVIADYNLPKFSALGALQLVRDRGLDLPVIIVSGAVGEEKAVAAMREGARDFIIKSNLSRLVPAIELREMAERRQRAQAEEALRHARARLQSIVENANIGVWEWDVATGDCFFSPEWKKQIGCAESEIEGKFDSWVDRLDPEDRAPVLASTRTFAEGPGTKYEQEFRLRHKDGTSRWVLARADGERDVTGRLLRMSGIHLDITERKHAEAQLLEAHALLEHRVKERTADLRKANQQLEAEIAERRRLEQLILDIGDQERQRIGYDLHDGICQKLAGVFYMIQTLESDLPEGTDTSERIREIGKHVRSTLEETRLLAHGVSPVAHTEEGLMQALELLARETARLFDIRCRFDCPRPVAVHNHSAATHLYRITQEAVQNAIRHGRASEVDIQLETADGLARLTIADNGSGIDRKPEDQGGMGIRIMHHRAAMIGGTVTIHPRRGGGTEVICQWKNVA
jgi:PAS domain S-box-containing protein